ncbi:ice-binding family protein [Streptomyces sp. ACA25]|uniref:ice-binding family protein n=1 Tax=Streptomyces sp. ACA25 TaxID=3022596 RepID=UPI002307CD71|nr:ice-binding family protein [Streptomyces sp. ACA25]MDB1086365.1 ice-binding family protein [Streptomyces sp. ACA25]
MTLNNLAVPQPRRTYAWIATALAVLLAAITLAVTPTPANAVATPVPLGTAESFAVLAGQSVTNTGPSVITGDVGVHPGTSITGFPPGTVLGTFHVADAVAAQAKSDLVTAYNNAAGQSTDALLPPDAGGLTLVPGVYTAPTSLGLTGTLTLDAQGDPNAVWVFQVGSTLTTASGSNVSLINGADPCNVFWQVGSSATLGTDSTFVGTIMALASITVTTGASIDGRALAREGSVTLDTNRITRPVCNGATTGETTNGLTTGGLTTGVTTGGITTGVTTGGLTTGVTTGGILGGATNGGTATGGFVTGGTTTGGTVTGGTVTGGTTGGFVTGGTTGGPSPEKPGKPGKPCKPCESDKDHDKDHGHDKDGKHKDGKHKDHEHGKHHDKEHHDKHHEHKDHAHGKHHDEEHGKHQHCEGAECGPKE